MSASDAAPLPRLGEVFFDVRGSSRSMRLSWYADTGVAVFSIWQGGMCTGTFRLPIGDLSRMIDILQRGPHGYDDEAGERGGAGYGESGYDGDYGPEYARDHDRDADYGPGEHGRREYGGPPAYGEPDYGAVEPGGRHSGSGGYGAGDYGAGQYGADVYGAEEYERPGYGADPYGAGEYGTGDYGGTAYRPADYDKADYGDPGHGRAGGHGPGGYDRSDYERPARGARTARWQDDRYQPDVTGQRSVAADESGYGPQRFVPPYVRAQADSSQAGFVDDSEYRLAADPAAGTRHSAGRHSSGQAQ